MRRTLITTYSAPFVIVGVMLIATTTAPSAQRRAAADSASLGVPVATNRILQAPDAYYGKLVTISAGIEQMLSKTAFLVDQRQAVGTTEVRAIGKPILVIAPYLTGPLDQKHYVLLRGEIVKFDAAAVARLAPDYVLDLPPGIGAKYAGQPALVVNSLIDSTYAERAKKPLAPPTADEVSLSAAMKTTVGPAFAALRTAAQASKGDLVTENAAKLRPAFTQTETIWEDLGQSAAAEWAREARDHADAIARAATTGDWEAVKASAGALNQLCQNCHGAYRERQEDGTFRFKPGSF